MTSACSAVIKKMEREMLVQLSVANGPYAAACFTPVCSPEVYFAVDDNEAKRSTPPTISESLVLKAYFNFKQTTKVCELRMLHTVLVVKLTIGSRTPVSFCLRDSIFIKTLY